MHATIRRSQNAMWARTVAITVVHRMLEIGVARLLDERP